MAVVMQMTWQGVTPEQYDQARETVGWETDAPSGGIFHVAWFEGGALRVLDVWETEEAFQLFVDGRLMPGVAEVGIEGEPEVAFQPAYRVFDAAHGDARS